MSNLSLYNITNQFVDLMNKAEEGELTEEEYNRLGQELALELQNKSTSIVGYVQNQAVFIEATEKQIKRLQKMKEAKQNSLDNFKKYVKENMERLRLSKVETEIGTISIAKSPISVEIVDEDKIPNKYKKVTQTTSIDKTAIKDKFKETGEVVKGTKILTENTYLKIK